MTGTLTPPVKLHQTKSDLSLVVCHLEYNKHVQQTLGMIKKLVNNDLLSSIEHADMAKAALNILKAQLQAKNTACFTTICTSC